jgi:rhodanese-related sulfurtransferase
MTATRKEKVMAPKITRDELKARLDRKERFALVEALPAKYYLDCHLPGAINLPHDQVDALAPALLVDKAIPVVVYCASGPCRNSGIAADRLIALGYRDVRDYHEGKEDWVDAGLPTESGPAAASRAA